MITVKIGGIDRTSLIRPGSLALPDRVNERSELSFQLVTSGYIPDPLDPVTVTDGAETLFEGFVWDPESEMVVEKPDATDLDVTTRCVDLHLLADRRLVAEVYTNKTVGFIFQDLVARYLAVEGVTCGLVDDGPLVTKAVFNLQSLSRCFDDLCEMVGFFWQLKAGRVAYFQDRASNVAPWSVTVSSAISNIKVRHHKEQYRNTQLVRAGQGTTDPRTESFVGDGENRNFLLAFPVANKPDSIKLNGVATDPLGMDIGIRGVDTDKRWYWNKDDKVISLDQYYTPPGVADVVAITYQGLYPMVIEHQEVSQVQARMALEGGSGIYEAVESAPQLDDITAVQELAQAKVDRYSQDDGTLTFQTLVPGLKAGQVLPVNLPLLKATGQWLITEVTMKHMTGDTYYYQVQAVAGDASGSWAEFFENLSLVGKQFTIRENEVLIKLKALPEVIGVTDSLTISRAVPSNKVGFAQVGYSQVG